MFLHFCAKIMQVHLLGIRHHGVGSAQQVACYLTDLRPDLVLVEGPPEFDSLLHWAAPDKGMVPPVALLGYDVAQPKVASFYPFSTCSPEWQAMQYALAQRIPVRMMDLPLAYMFELEERAGTGSGDPLAELARMDGYPDSESWWEYRFESGSDTDASAHFEAVLIAMTALREAQVPSALDAQNHYREAWMRQLIRDAARDMFACVAVVCGAWHTPALTHALQSEKADRAILKVLNKPKRKIATTWVPWTNNRLALKSGYGAGIAAPAWSLHRWHHRQHLGASWLTHCARLLRQQGKDVATAQVIDAERLSTALAAISGLSAPGLAEFQAAIVTVFCMGDPTLFHLVQQELLVGQMVGVVPPELPQVPLQVDFEQQVKRLKLKLNAEVQELVLDLRNTKNAVDRERSVLLHCLLLLEVAWAKKVDSGRTKGSFKETWELDWQPEIMVTLIERSAWGNTVAEAAAAWALDRVEQLSSLSQLTQLMEQVLPANLPEVMTRLIERLRVAAALSTDVVDLMTAVQPFVQVIRYGDARQSDQAVLHELLGGFVERICLGLPAAAQLVDDESAQQLFGLVQRTHAALFLLHDAHLSAQWAWALQQIAAQQQANPLLNGCTLRLLFEARLLTHTDMTRRFALALSTGQMPEYAASWVEGFLKGSSANLLYDNHLWEILFQWINELDPTHFKHQLPLLRRTFATFAPNERRRLGEKARQPQPQKAQSASPELDTQGKVATDNLAAMVQLVTFDYAR
jgi:Family of unknown function (DUF5682)